MHDKTITSMSSVKNTDTDINAQTDSLVMHLSRLCQAARWHLITAESCSGGGIASAITRLPGSSAWFDGAFVTYSNDLKQSLLHVPAAILDTNGAVSAETVTAMVYGALKMSSADIALAVSGIAGPAGASTTKPVGLVWFAVGDRAGHCHAVSQNWSPSDLSEELSMRIAPAEKQDAATALFNSQEFLVRQWIRHNAVLFALQMLIDFINEIRPVASPRGPE